MLNGHNIAFMGLIWCWFFPFCGINELLTKATTFEYLLIEHFRNWCFTSVTTVISFYWIFKIIITIFSSFVRSLPLLCNVVLRGLNFDLKPEAKIPIFFCSTINWDFSRRKQFSMRHRYCNKVYNRSFQVNGKKDNPSSIPLYTDQLVACAPWVIKKRIEFTDQPEKAVSLWNFIDPNNGIITCKSALL